jgi:hypothetical protein
MNKCDKCGADNARNAKYCCGCGYELPKPIIEEIQHPNSELPPKRDYKKLTGIIVSVISFFIAYFIVQQLFFKIPSFDKAMMKVASELNKTCPIMVDSETRLDNAIALPKKIFQYNYTLINIDKKSVDTLEMKNYLGPNITNFVRTNPDMKFQRDNKTIINYCYKDRNGNYLFKISVTPEQYK